MSEFQYYEFRALDRRLTPDQQRRLRSLSRSRRADDTAAFTARVRELRTRYAKRPSLLVRFDMAGPPRLK